MKAMLVAAGLVLACVIPATSAHAQSAGSQAFEAAFGPCRGSTCVIRSNPGGEVRRFIAAADWVRSGAKRLIVIDGPCASACVIFADLARERVCITDRAVFGFHKATLLRAEVSRSGQRRVREIARHDPGHSADIAHWVYRNGGFPTRGMRAMSAAEAGRFWQRCEIRRARG